MRQNSPSVSLLAVTVIILLCHRGAAAQTAEGTGAVVGLERTVYQTAEGVGVVEVCAIVYSPHQECPIPFPFNVSLSTVDHIAVAPMDYETLSTTLMFAACDTRRCVNVAIVNDIIVESIETFAITLERTSNLDSRITLNPMDEEIEIIDNDLIEVGLEETFYQVSEDVGAVNVCAVIKFYSSKVNCPVPFSFDINFSTSDGSAAAPSDYESLSTILTFDACETRSCVAVTIYDDIIQEVDKHFGITLKRSADLDSRIVLVPVLGQIGINDNDEFRTGCYSSINCTGEVVVGPHTARECCVGTDDGHSYAVDGVCTVVECRVHGFEHALYTLREGETLSISFTREVKGRTVFPFLRLDGLITSEADTAENTTDFISVRVTTGSTGNHNIQLSAVDDDIANENDERFTLQFVHSFGQEIFDVVENLGEFLRDTATVIIIDSDCNNILVGLTETSAVGLEDVGTIEICAAIISVDSSDCTFDFSFEVHFRTESDSADSPADYVSVDTLLTFEPNSTESCVGINIINDIAIEQVVSFIVTLEAPADLDDRVSLSPAQGSVTIIDDDVTIIGVEFLTVTVSEEVTSGAVEVCVVIFSPRLACPIIFPFEINFYTEPISAGPGEDYTGLVTSRLRFGRCETRQCVNIQIINDERLEDTESFNVSLEVGRGVNSRFILDPQEVSMYITDADVAVVDLERVNYQVTEGGTVVVCALVSSPNISCPVTFSFEVSLSVGDDDQLMIFSPCDRRSCVAVPFEDDDVVEETELVAIRLERTFDLSNRITIGVSSSGVVEITDDNDTALVGLEKTFYQFSEDSTINFVCIEVFGSGCPINFPITVSLSTSDITARSPGDYRALTEQLVELTACTTLHCVNVDIIDDQAVENPESFGITLERTPDLDSRITLDPVDGVVQIRDDDELRTVCYSSTNCTGEVVEGSLTARECCVGTDDGHSYAVNGVCTVVECTVHGFEHALYTLREGENLTTSFTKEVKGRTVFPFVQLTGLITSEADTAENTTDFISVRVTTGNAGSRSIQLSAVDDDIANENDERFTLQFVSSFGPEIFDVVENLGEFLRDTATVIIIDSDCINIVVGLTETSLIGSEDVGTIEICAAFISGDCTFDVFFEVHFRTEYDSADSPSDYISVDTLLTFGPNSTESCVGINIINDIAIEQVESFIVTLEAPADLDDRVSLSPAQGRVTIIDDDEAVVGLERTFYQVNEDVGEVQVCVSVPSPDISCPVTYPFTVVLATVAESAGEVTDYERVLHVVEFTSCQRRHCVSSISIVDDLVLEDIESFNVSIVRNGLDNSISLRPTAAKIEISDNDVAVVGLQQTVYQVDEGAGDVHVCVEVKTSSQDCIIQYPFGVTFTTSNITAHSSEEYEAVDTTLVVVACQRLSCEAIPIRDDLEVENEKSFEVTLERTSDLDSRITIHPTRAKVIITDDDAVTVQMEHTTYQVSEDGGSIEVCAIIVNNHTAECPVNFPISVRLSSSDGDAVAGEDYQQTTTRLIFDACSHRSCTNVTILNDVRVEPLVESFSVSLSEYSPDTRIRVNPQPVSLVITDDDESVVSLVNSIYRVRESVGKIQVCARVRQPKGSCPIRTSFSVLISTGDDTAESPDDFTALSSTLLTFDECVKRRCVNIPIVDDMLDEMTESFSITLHRTAALDNRITLGLVDGVIEIIDND